MPGKGYLLTAEPEPFLGCLKPKAEGAEGMVRSEGSTLFIVARRLVY